MEFDSQICTTREQSERLLALGLKKETADMAYVALQRWNGNDFENIDKYEILVPDEELAEYYNRVFGTDDLDTYCPAWSLHRLIEIAEKSGLNNVYIEDNWYDEIIAIIQSYIHLGYIKKEYLDMDIVNANEEKNIELLKNGGIKW